LQVAAVEAQSGAEDDAEDDEEEDSDAEDADDDTAADVTGSGRFDEEEDMFVGLDDPQLVRTLQRGCSVGEECCGATSAVDEDVTSKWWDLACA
jgi:hypothetical protein